MSDRFLSISEPQIGPEERNAVERVLRAGRLTQGDEVIAFEDDVASRLAGTRYAIAVSSGTAALELALECLGIAAADEVVTTPFTFAATVNAILRRGATVRFADIAEDFTLDPASAVEASGPRTRWLLAVHLYGLPADVDELSEIRPVIEDAAQAHLAELGGRRVGGLGVAGCFSFYATKNMTTSEGGAVTTNDADLAARVQILRNQGMVRPYEYAAVGTNLRMTEIAAAIGRVQLRRLAAMTDARRRNAEMLNERMVEIPGVSLPVVPAGRRHAWHQYTVRLAPEIDRDVVIEKLRSEGIETCVYYPRILADVPMYRDHARVVVGTPLDRAREAARRVLSLPIHPGISAHDIDRIAEALTIAVGSTRERS